MNQKEREEHEIKLLTFVESVGFICKAIVPYANYDEYIFAKKDGVDELNLEISFNGQGYRVATGHNGYVFYQNNKFDMSWENLQFHVFHFNLDKMVDTDNEFGGE